MEIFGMSGERLGIIGQESESSSASLPTWKKDFLSLPSISIRRGIAWNYNPPFEDTDTLVLTASSGKFVDLRLPKAVSPSEALYNHQSFWAFSGKSVTTFHDKDSSREHSISMPYSAHCKFIHDIDSKGPGITDEGDMFILSNGDVAETGMMENPASGQNELYKEYWTSPKSGDAEDLNVGTGNVTKNPCIVAEVSGNSTRGIAIRIGDYFQGILETSTGLQFERQQRQNIGTTAFPESWKRDSRSTADLPLTWLCSVARELGDILVHNGMTWKVTEKGI